MDNNDIEYLDCDVLVIGSGGTGSQAVQGAAEEGGGRTGRAARSWRCRRRCASSPPPAWGSWVACSWGLPSHQQPAGAVDDRVRCAWNQNHGVDVGQNTSVVVRRRTLTTGRRLVTETRGAILLQNSVPCRREKPHACWPHLL